MSIGGLIREFRAVSPEMCQKALSDFLNGTTNGDDLRLYVKAGADVNGLFEGQTALIRAICADNVEAFEMILSDGPNLEVKAGEVPAGTVGVLVGDTAVIVACRLRQWGMVRSLVAEGANVDAVGRDGKKALQVACEAAEKQLDPDSQDSNPDFDPEDCLRQHYEPQQGDPVIRSAVSDALKDLLTLTSDVAGMKISARDECEDESLVSFFSWHEFEKLVLLSLSRGVDIDSVDASSYTALLNAASRVRPYYVSLLTENGADVNKQTAVPIFSTVLSPVTEESRILSALKVFEIMLDCGANPNVQDFVGDTVLREAVRIGTIPSVVRFLVEKGADLTMQNNSAKTPHALAVELSRSAEIVALLMPSVNQE
mmetsp:Transcript_15981/g.32416  ORF Transcript_15981/g.32416 Transcript_15981/m.32416 type:complete len:370 (-) Transcript_15981:72-1181(-)